MIAEMTGKAFKSYMEDDEFWGSSQLIHQLATLNDEQWWGDSEEVNDTDTVIIQGGHVIGAYGNPVHVMIHIVQHFEEWKRKQSLKFETTNLVCEAEGVDGETVAVMRLPGNRYNVVKGDIIRHPDCDAEAVMRALTHYLHDAAYKLQKATKPT